MATYSEKLAQALQGFAEGGAPVRDGISKLFRGDVSPLRGAYGEVKQLFDPEYMKNVKGTSQSDMMDVALNANPMMAGTFIGKGAKTWDMAKHNKALDMAKNGLDERKIWADTGNFKGADGHWRQEISDHNAKFVPTKLDKPYQDYHDIYSAKAGNSLSHDELYKAYPSTKDIDLIANPRVDGRGEYHAANDNIGLGEYVQLGSDRLGRLETETDYLNRLKDNQHPDYWKTQAKEFFDAGDYGSLREAKKDFIKEVRSTNNSVNELKNGVMWPLSDSSVKSTTLHELQHAIQGREGFAKGGSPESMKDEALSMLRRDVASGEIGSTEQAMSMLPMAQQNAYQRLAGEAEARATQARMNLTPQERLAKFPFDSYDVPRESLIVRGMFGGGI